MQANSVIRAIIERLHDMISEAKTIAAGLGHSQGGVTDIYIKFSQRKIDEANRRVIDTVNS